MYNKLLFLLDSPALNLRDQHTGPKGQPRSRVNVLTNDVFFEEHGSVLGAGAGPRLYINATALRASCVNVETQVSIESGGVTTIIHQ